MSDLKPEKIRGNSQNSIYKMNRPKVNIQKEYSDRTIRFIGLFALGILICLPLFNYNALPETIPQHFNLYGEPDAYGPKSIIWLLPIVGILLYVGMSWLSRYPHIFNYPIEITEENAAFQYKNAVRMINVLATLITCAFAYITFAMIQVALGNQQSLGTAFIIVFLLLIFGTMGYYIVKSLKSK